MKEKTVHGAKIALAIETSGRVGSVALGRGDTVLGQSVFSGFMKQSAELFPHIQMLLTDIQSRPCDIKTVIITIGPGSFTGLRIAVTAAKMVYFAQQVNIVAVDSTDVIAQNAPEFADNDPCKPVDCICTILDAKRDLFYASVFERAADGWTKIFGTQAVSAADLLDWLSRKGKEKVYFLGEGLVYYAKKFEASFAAILDEQYWLPQAAGLLRVGQKLAAQGKFADAATLKPLYIRKPDAIEKWQNRQK